VSVRIAGSAIGSTPVDRVVLCGSGGSIPSPERAICARTESGEWVDVGVAEIESGTCPFVDPTFHRDGLYDGNG